MQIYLFEISIQLNYTPLKFMMNILSYIQNTYI